MAPGHTSKQVTMAARRVQFEDSLLHRSLEELHLAEAQMEHLTDAVLSAVSKPFYTSKSECEVLGLQPDEDKTKIQLRLTYLLDKISHTTLNKVVEALHGILVTWTLQFDAQRMHLILVLIFVNRDEESSFSDDRSKKRRRRVDKAKGDTVTMGAAPRNPLSRARLFFIDQAAAVNPETQWMRMGTAAQGVLKKEYLTKKLGSSEDTVFVITLLQTIVGQEEHIPRIFVGLTTREGQYFILHVGGLIRWTSAQYHFIMDHYGSKIEKVTYGYSSDYNGMVNFTVKRAAAILE